MMAAFSGCPFLHAVFGFFLGENAGRGMAMIGVVFLVAGPAGSWFLLAVSGRGIPWEDSDVSGFDFVVAGSLMPWDGCCWWKC